MSPQSEQPHATPIAESAEYSSSERRLLLRLAHQSIETALRGGEFDLSSPGEHLAEFRGAFVTLHIQDRLRGCIGFVAASRPLFRTIVEAARGAAFDDPRFEPVTETEAPALKVEISVLSPLRTIAADDVVVGKHGLVVTQGNCRGLLLPQVPLEWGWDRETFLEQTCLKAGLETDAWRHGAELQAFKAEVFGEE
jgi:AmmeMemoRadiSam system protein A